MLIDARRLPIDTTLRADVVVIGAGPAGLTIAAGLTAQGHHVVLTEAGGPLHQRADDDTLDGMGSGRPFPLVPSRHRGFGGTSSRWTPATGLRVRPLDDVDFAARPGRPRDSWPFGPDELAPHYAAALDDLGVGRDFAPERWFPTGSPSPLAWSGGPELAMFQFAPHDSFTRRYQRMVADPCLDLLMWAPVVRLDTDRDDGHVTRVAVRVPGGEIAIGARIVVVAGGAIESTRLLLASPGRTGAGLGNEHDLLGRYFMDHLSVDSGRLEPAPGVDLRTGVFREVFEGDEKRQAMLWLGGDRLTREGLLNAAFWVEDIDPSYGAAGVGAARQLRLAWRSRPRRDLARHARAALRGVPDLVRYARTRRRPPSTTALRILTEQLPDRDSRVRLADVDDAHGLPRVDVDWRVSADDLALVRAHQDLLHRLLAERGVARVAGRFDPDRHPSPVMSNYHHLGGTRMHVDERHGVVDADCRMHASPNLYVVSGSVFPTGGYLNPTLTILALAHRAAISVARELRPVRVGSGTS